MKTWPFRFPLRNARACPVIVVGIQVLIVVVLHTIELVPHAVIRREARRDFVRVLGIRGPVPEPLAACETRRRCRQIDRTARRLRHHTCVRILDAGQRSIRIHCRFELKEIPAIEILQARGPAVAQLFHCLRIGSIRVVVLDVDQLRAALDRMLALLPGQVLVDLRSILRSAIGQAAVGRVRIVEAGKLNVDARPRNRRIHRDIQRRRILQLRIVCVEGVEPAETQLRRRRQRRGELVGQAVEVCLVVCRSAHVELRIRRGKVAARLVGLFVFDKAPEHLRLLAQVIVPARHDVIGVLRNPAARVFRRVECHRSENRGRRIKSRWHGRTIDVRRRVSLRKIESLAAAKGAEEALNIRSRRGQELRGRHACGQVRRAAHPDPLRAAKHKKLVFDDRAAGCKPKLVSRICALGHTQLIVRLRVRRVRRQAIVFPCISVKHIRARFG